jgi:iron complex transport system substrate-binding protein
MVRPTRSSSSARAVRVTSARSVAVAAAATAALGLALALAGCGAAPADIPTAAPGAPVVVENCDTTVQFAAAPQRVVTIKSTSTEMLLALGLGDRIVGTAFPDGPVPDEWAGAAADLPLLSEQMPSEEAVLELEPDLVYSGWESAFAPDAAGDRAELAALGVASYVQPAACRSTEVAKLTFDELFREIGEVAEIFRVDATPLLDGQRAELEALVPDDRGLTALWYSSGTDTPYVGAGTGAPQPVLETVGLANLAGDIDSAWTSLGWEAIVDADPDVIVLIDADWNTAASKMLHLAANPATAKLDAVVHQRYLILPFASAEAGVRTVSAATSLAEQLAALDLP